MLVSSHAPVRGHLLRWISTRKYNKVSSHAPVRGHPKVSICSNELQRVSSHAPVRGHLQNYTKKADPYCIDHR